MRNNCTSSEGLRQVRRMVPYYNLDMIPSVGYRVNSRNTTQFRIRANKVLNEYLIKIIPSITKQKPSSRRNGNWPSACSPMSWLRRMLRNPRRSESLSERRGKRRPIRPTRRSRTARSATATSVLRRSCSSGSWKTTDSLPPRRSAHLR